jgi:hypothetical protein
MFGSQMPDQTRQEALGSAHGLEREVRDVVSEAMPQTKRLRA